MLDDDRDCGFEPTASSTRGLGGKIWGIVSILAGLLFFACLFTFRIDEIRWTFLNPEAGGKIISCTNFLGLAGLYVAGIFYWLFGGAVWFLWAYLIWTGVYRIFHCGILPRLMVYTGLGAVLLASVFMAVQPWVGANWASVNHLYGPGGAMGHLFGALILKPFLGVSGTIAVSVIAYFILLVYVSGTHPVALCKGLKKEWIAFLEYRRKRKQTKIQNRREELERLARESARTASAVAKWKKEAPLTDDAPAAPAREKPVRRKRSGDSLAELDEPPPAKQEELGLNYEPKIVDASQTKNSSRVDVETPFPQMTNDAAEGFENYSLPSLSLLKCEEVHEEQTETDKAELLHTQNVIIDTLRSFGVEVSPGNITKGPTITRYEIYPAPGLRVSQITKLEPDIARATKAVRINILAPIPGRDTVGIEIANVKKVPVCLRELLQDISFTAPGKKIPVALGKDVYGNTVIGDLAAMPHLLVAGTTGSGKSVCINSLITSMIYKFRPDELRFILVDPKVVEMQPYSKLPHLIVPVVTDPKKVIGALRWCVNEMERRYRIFAEVGVRNFDSFNKRPKAEAPAEDQLELEEEQPVDEELIESIAQDFESQGESPRSLWAEEEEDDLLEEQEIPDRFPYVVIIIDELADLMQTVKDDIELYIGRITQKARAAGIHLIVATQTPRSEVVTGIIKANIPCRIAFQVSSALDSRIILDQPGAEKLVGKGDLLYLPPGSAKLERAQGAYISDEEVELVVDHCSSQARQEFHSCLQESIESIDGGQDGGDEVDAGDEELFRKCVEIVRGERKASISLLQRRLRIGFNKAARIIELMEHRGVVGPSDGSSRPREVLLPPIE